MLSGKYAQLYREVSSCLPENRIITDDLRTLAYGTDASFYRLIPKIVIKVENESEVIFILNKCRELNIPMTVRAAGTSLSGQAISDSVLILTGNGWRNYRILDEGNKIRLQPGVIGGHANLYLSPYGRKIGPDPASINAAMVGGIAANNASGMCCGTAENSYRTLAGMKIIFTDGTLLDTNEPESIDSFRRSHRSMLDKIAGIAERVRANEPLADRIRHKYKIKNTTGYSLNALVDFDDPIEILQHLMIGSEGTLAFIAEVTYHTVPEHRHKASAMIYFPDIKTACEAVIVLKKQNVSAVELIDRAALRSVEHKPGMPPFLKDFGPAVAALLVETRSETKEGLDKNIGGVIASISHLPKARDIEFTDDPAEYTKLWNIRKGLFPALGVMRRIGTTVVIEDVAFPIETLADATLDLQKLLGTHGYHEAIIFGHALEGNLHFVFNQDFNSEPEIVRYRYFMDDVTRMVVHKYDGSLKAEHGTGRNMAPFVEMEWGAEAYGLMKEIKRIFDPGNILNPGVLLNDDPLLYLRNLKPMPPADEIIDKCIECGFCEINCPSRDLTLTPRQRIVALREIARLTASGEDPHRLHEMNRIFDYQGEQTCATDGMCATSCPVDIDTGSMIKQLRARRISPTADSVADIVAGHLGVVVDLLRFGLNVANGINRIFGSPVMNGLATAASKLTGAALPRWNEYMPRSSSPVRRNGVISGNGTSQVVYVPSCVSRLFGTSNGSGERDSQIVVTESVLRKAGFEVVYPDNLKDLCCGMAFASKGYTKQGMAKLREMEKSLRSVSRNGILPILMDTSPCTHRMKELFGTGLKVFEPATFILEFLSNRLIFRKLQTPVAVHVPCSSKKMGIDMQLRQAAALCSDQVIIPPLVGCCGFAGDRGFTHPELPRSALSNLRDSLPESVLEGFSTSRGCEIGLSAESGIQYKSLMYLIDRCSVSSSEVVA